MPPFHTYIIQVLPFREILAGQMACTVVFEQKFYLHARYQAQTIQYTQSFVTLYGHLSAGDCQRRDPRVKPTPSNANCDMHILQDHGERSLARRHARQPFRSHHLRPTSPLKQSDWEPHVVHICQQCIAKAVPYHAEDSALWDAKGADLRVSYTERDRSKVTIVLQTTIQSAGHRTASAETTSRHVCILDMWLDRYWASSSISQLGIREHYSTRDRKMVPITSLNDPDYGVSGLHLHFSRGQPCMTVVSRIYANERKLHSFHHHASQHAQLQKANWTPFTSGVSKEPPLCASPKRVTTDPPASEGLR
ncbi:hypothetical protein B0T13DRAFT_149047 [Neurospora crassa]|nr:hypothetical protein B0T13DRAFT_149047 [Neurospora crassa]